MLGGGGRYLILHLKEKQTLAVFDTSAGEIVKQIPVPSDKILFAAGADSLIVLVQDQCLIQRWSLKSFELELTRQQGGLLGRFSQAGEEPATGQCSVEVSADFEPAFLVISLASLIGGTLRIDHVQLELLD